MSPTSECSIQPSLVDALLCIIISPISSESTPVAWCSWCCSSDACRERSSHVAPSGDPTKPYKPGMIVTCHPGRLETGARTGVQKGGDSNTQQCSPLSQTGSRMLLPQARGVVCLRFVTLAGRGRTRSRILRNCRFTPPYHLPKPISDPRHDNHVVPPFPSPHLQQLPCRPSPKP